MLSLFFVLLALAAPPDPSSLSLEDAMRLAASRRPAVAAAERRLAAADAIRRGAGTQPNPELRLGVTAGEPESRANSVVQRLEVAGQPALRHENAAQAAALAREELRQVRRGAARDAALAYHGLWEARQRRAVTGEQLRLAEEVAGAARRRYEAGEIPLNEELRTRLEADRFRGALLQAEGEESPALARLNLLLGRGWDAPLELREPDAPAPPPGSLDELLARSATRPEVEAARFAVRAAELQTELAGRSRAPDLEVALGRPRLASAEGQSASLSVVLPLWDWGSLSAEAEARRARAEALRQDVEERARDVRQEVLDAWSLLQVALAQREVMAEQAARHVRLVQMARKGYDAGLLTLVEVVDAQRAAREAALGSVAAEADSRRARVQLQWASGGLLPGDAEVLP